MAKGKSIKIRMVSESGDFFTTTKNPKMPNKLKLRRFDKKTRAHAWFEEKKIK